MRRGFWFFWAAVFWSGALTSLGSASERVALVIGNSDYESIGDLPNAGLDVEVLAKRLVAGGFTVISATGKDGELSFSVDPARVERPGLYDLNADDMKRALRFFTSLAKDAELAVVYFAGHGLEIDGKNYLTGKEVVLEVDESLPQHLFEASLAGRLIDETLPLDMLLHEAREVGQNRLFILDCCRENPFSRDRGWARQRSSVDEGLAEVGEEVLGLGTVLIFSGAPGRKVPDGRTGDHSPFAKALFAALDDSKSSSVMDTIYTLRRQYEHRERPWMKSDGDIDTLARLDQLPFLVGAGSDPMLGSRAGEVRSFGGIEMVWCPPTGEEGFLMGSLEDDRYFKSTSELQHEVEISRGFWLAKYECTQGQWERVMGRNPSHFEGSKNLPVERVSWEDVDGWLAEMNREHPLPRGWEWVLPTEAQWEYGCRAGTTSAYSSGETLDESDARFKVSLASVSLGTKKVGSYAGNAWGLHDMHGNVAEWISDWIGVYDGMAKRDPTGPEEGSKRVVRGGSFIRDVTYCRSAARWADEPRERHAGLGFRPAVSFVE
ncbi:MAG: SUMF1/EgtB/PvdO family nonheme iron enzyme [Verrucomicrobiota bacterium]